MQETIPVITEEIKNKLKRDLIELIEDQYGVEIIKVIEIPTKEPA